MKESGLLVNDNILSGNLADDTDALIAQIRPKIERNLKRCYRDTNPNREYMFGVNASMAVKKRPPSDFCRGNDQGRHTYSNKPPYTCIYCGQDNPNPPETGWDILTKQARAERDNAWAETESLRAAKDAIQNKYIATDAKLAKKELEIINTRAEAERQAWYALKDEVYSKFNIWASIWHHMNKLSEDKADDPFVDLLDTAKTACLLDNQTAKAAEHE